MTVAFTLIELLVVLAVIGVLAALLLPALARAKGAALATECVNNERQLAMAFTLYCEEYRDTFPTGATGSDLGAHPEDWLWWQLKSGADGERVMRDGRGSALAPYMGGYRSSYFRCPADRGALKREAAWKRDRDHELFIYSYSLNGHSRQGMASYISKDRSVIRLNKLSSVVNPSQKIMLAEEKGGAEDGPGTAWIDDGRWQPLGYPLTVRHEGRANVAFPDAHVERVPRQFAGADHPEHFDPLW